LEITETAAINLGQDGYAALEPLRALANLGVRIAVDDFGTGYLSLKLLRDVPVREIKIDMSVVARLARDSTVAAIVRATLDLAHSLGMEVVAEGVEDDATWRRPAEPAHVGRRPCRCAISTQPSSG
jgi:EAL domain-containing protein (putative c-di-GMP-specific phosphodiesterase class I)